MGKKKLIKINAADPLSMLAITIDYSLFTEKITDLGKKLVPYAKVMAQRFAEIGYNMIKARTPPTKTGTDIRGLWVLEQGRTASREEWIVRNTYKNQDIIVFMEEGTKAHIIKAKGKWPLHFFLDNGTEIYARKVRHPGTPAYEMIDGTRRFLDPKIRWYVEQVIKEKNAIMKQGSA